MRPWDCPESTESYKAMRRHTYTQACTHKKRFSSESKKARRARFVCSFFFFFLYFARNVCGIENPTVKWMICGLVRKSTTNFMYACDRTTARVCVCVNRQESFLFRVNCFCLLLLTCLKSFVDWPFLCRLTQTGVRAKYWCESTWLVGIFQKNCVHAIRSDNSVSFWKSKSIKKKKKNYNQLTKIWASANGWLATMLRIGRESTQPHTTTVVCESVCADRETGALRRNRNKKTTHTRDPIVRNSPHMRHAMNWIFNAHTIFIRSFVRSDCCVFFLFLFLF